MPTVRISKTLRDLYDVRKLVEMPLYPLSAAARYCQVHPNTIRSWVLGRSYTAAGRVQHWPPLVRPADPSGDRLSFMNVVELHVLASLRRVHDVPVPTIRRAIEHMRKLYKDPHPLAHPRMRAHARQVFVDEIRALVNVSQSGQTVMREVLGASLQRVTHQSQTPVTLFPWPDKPMSDAPTFVAIDPRVAFGKPYLVASGVPTATVYERFSAGDSTKALAHDLTELPEAIDHAIRLEQRPAA